MKSGAFEVVKKRREGDVVLARLEELSFFGEMSLATKKPRVASVVCVEPGRLKRFPIKRFEELLDRDEPAASKVIRSMCGVLADRLARLESRLVSEVWRYM